MRVLLLCLFAVIPSTVQAKAPVCRPTPAVLLGHAPKDGFVPDAATAIQIATAIWLPVYGEAVLNEKPFNAVLRNDVWVVTGSLPPNARGGVAEAHLCKSDASIVYVAHGK